MPEIRELDAETRDRIAAGEVVERPASVVKELLENALDADASRIDVAVENGGIDRIEVADDGIGMSRSDVRTAVEEHTTSKLRTIEDLAGVGTLGFRGEALHAIGAVSRLRIETRPRGVDRGTELVVEGGSVDACGPTGCPEGTTVEVTRLFENVPARRGYLKTPATEFDHVARIVGGYALARPDVAISLHRDDREAFATVGDGDRRSAVAAVYGREVADAMIAVDSDSGDGPLRDVEGLISHPETNRSGSEYVTTLVNGRYVTAGAVREAVLDAYGDALAPDRYPFAVLDLDLPPGAVDVNVHPRKLEVLFSDESGVKAGVSAAVERALVESGTLRTRAPRGRSAPDQTEIRNEVGEGGSTPDSRPDDPSRADDKGENEDTKRRLTPRPDPPTSDDPGDTSGPTSDPIERSELGSEDNSKSDTMSADSKRSSEPTDSDPSLDRDRFEQPTQTTLTGTETTGTPGGFDRLPELTVLGQFDDTYIVAEGDQGLVLIDQHAADERVHYERLRAALSGDLTAQALAEPVQIDATAREVEIARARGAALAELGFDIGVSAERTIAVRSVPAALADRAGEAAPTVARDLLSEFVDGDPEGTVKGAIEELLADLACHPAVTGNTSLREGSVTDLLAALDRCENPYACPHGRPTVIAFPTEEIEDRFERDYPGHGGRRG